MIYVPADPPSPFALPAACRQLLVVTVPDWTSTTGELRRFVREAAGGPWQACGAALAVSLGRAGLAWGRGLQPPQAGDQKGEGDGKAPAGIFAISALFGYAPADSEFARAARLPYLAASPDLLCVDDPASIHYNRLVDRTTVAADWASAEEMRRADARYEIGAVLGHNCTPVQAGAGSCVFLHVWQAPGVATAGCTALALAGMRELAGWLDGERQPLLVQLPLAEYERRRQAWGLPGLFDKPPARR